MARPSEAGVFNIDRNGKVVVKYYYDAWGNTITEVLDQTAYYRLFSKKNCLNFAEEMVRLKGGKLSVKTMAIEIFAHAILFILGIVLGIVAVFSVFAFFRVVSAIYKIISIIVAIACGVGSWYLISHAYSIDITLNKEDGRQKFYKLIWNIF